MTIGVGGLSQEEALSKLANMVENIQPIQAAEYQQRLAKAQDLMVHAGLEAIYLNAGTNLYYFTGTKWYASERMVRAILINKGHL